MKVLITDSNKVVAFGEFVHAQAGQTIVDTDELTVKQILELAAANKTTIAAKKKADIVDKLKGFLAEHNTEVTEMSDAQKFEEVVVSGFAEKLSDDDISENLYKAGCPFKDIDKTLKQIIADKGLRLSPKERNAKAAEFLEGYQPDATDVESHLAKVSALQDFLDCSTTQAGASMRKWAKDNDITLPKVVAKAKSKLEPGFRGNIKIVADWALAQDYVPTLEQLVAYASANIPPTKGGKVNSSGYALTVANAIIFANALYGVSDEAEVEIEEAA